jgi:5'-methylthioadenosine phosphorylase
VKHTAEVGVFGGSGFYRFARGSVKTSVKTPYGPPSAGITFSTIDGKRVAFLPRHGLHHEFPPHMVPYRANVYALKNLGVTRVLGPCATGSLKPELAPGHIVFCDQFVNFTNGRKDTYYDGPLTTHVSSSDPYCPELRAIAIESADRLGLDYHRRGTVVVIQGPRFSSRAESMFFRSQGWDVINMTQYPEAILARELELCYLNISLVTDYDVGLEGDPKAIPVSHEQVVKAFDRNMKSLMDLIVHIVKNLPEKRDCDCGSALRHARLSA